MNAQGLLFVALCLSRDEVRGRRVLEVGACDVNGSVRPLIESYGPASYTGVDIAPGPGVDVICDVSSLGSRFGRNSFDIVIATELLEHVRDWRGAVHAIKEVCAPGGTILLTTRSRGFPYHGYPHDFWRYERPDMECIFGDCALIRIEPDPARGIFLKAVKKEPFVEQDLSAVELYSIVAGRRVRDITDADLRTARFRLRVTMAKVADRLFMIIGDHLACR